MTTEQVDQLDLLVTRPARATAQAATPSQDVGPIVVLGERIKQALSRRAGRFRVALLVFVLLLPLLLTSLLAER